MNPFGFGDMPSKSDRKDQRREAFRHGEAMKNRPWPKGRRKMPREISGKRDEREQD